VLRHTLEFQLEIYKSSKTKDLVAKNEFLTSSELCKYDSCGERRYYLCQFLSKAKHARFISNEKLFLLKSR
jgi:hypothetical protein